MEDFKIDSYKIVYFRGEGKFYKGKTSESHETYREILGEILKSKDSRRSNIIVEG